MGKMKKYVRIMYDNSYYGNSGNYEEVIVRLDAIKAINVSQGVIHMGNCNYSHVREEDVCHIIDLINEEIDCGEEVIT